MGLFGVAFVLYGGNLFVEAVQTSTPGWITDASIGGVEFAFGLFAIAVAFLTGATAKEVDKEKDKNFVVAVFSGIVSLVALVVSFVALVQGVS